MKGLKELQKTLRDASEALQNLDGTITTLKFDPNDPASVNAAIAEMEGAIDVKMSPWRGNEIIENLIEQAKEQYRERVLDKATAAQTDEDRKVDQTIFRQVENTVTDLRRAEYTSFDRHIQKLSRLLHSDELDKITTRLAAGIDLDAWLEAGRKTRGGMVGSAKLDWPSDPKQELGIVILLIDEFAQKEREALDFSHTFYYNGSKLTANLRNMVEQMIVPFSRDYIDYVKSETGTPEATLIPARTGPAARKAFIVHGHEDGPREAVARFLERVGFEAVILHEQANQGRTIIEKIEAHGEVGFAVVLLTPDDVGGVKNGEMRPRARQNVILELGYFVARLGRSRVCALKVGDIEIPSDFYGVVYVPFDQNNGWKMALCKELKAAGFEIDLNRI